MGHEANNGIGKPDKQNVSAQMGLKFLGFRLGAETFGFELLSVREIIRLTEITPIPRAPSYIRGIINLRGKIIPVVDLRKKFGLPPQADTDVSCIIVVDIGSTETGVVVDRVAQVLSFDRDQIEDPPSFNAAGETDYILGIGKNEQRVVVLLDVAKIMAAKELSEILSRAQRSSELPGEAVKKTA